MTREIHYTKTIFGIIKIKTRKGSMDPTTKLKKSHNVILSIFVHWWTDTWATVKLP